jgi:3-hydroxybutyryl-CoA dehydrogenase
MKLLIIGSGKMGTDLINYLSGYPIDILWLCLDEDQKQKAESAFQKKLGRQLRTGILNNEEHADILNRIRITADISLAADRDFVIEAIWEDPDAKRCLFHMLDDILPEETIITSNTSSIPIERLVPSDRRKRTFAGLHFFFPVKLHNIAEINSLSYIDTDCPGRIRQFLASVERKSILLPEGNHFLLNRLLLPLQNEAFQMMKEKRLTEEEIDRFVKEELFPFGIFEFFDHVGIDIMLASLKNYAGHFAGETDYSGLIACFQSLVSEGKLGVKSGEGFYKYPFMHADPEVRADHYSVAYQRLSDAFYGSIRNAFGQNIAGRADLEYAINEYLGTDIVPLAKNAGYDF